MAQDFISAPPTRGPVDEFDQNGAPVRVTRGWGVFFSGVFAVCFAQAQSGTTAQRPTVGLYAGRRYWDETLQMPIYWTGSAWKKSDGTAA